MHDVAWRGMWISVRSKDAQKQLARTSLTNHSIKFHKIVLNAYSSRSRAPLRQTFWASSELFIDIWNVTAIERFI